MTLTERRKQQLVLLLCIAAGTVLFAYVATRAYRLSFTHDESYSWNEIAQHSVMEVVSYNTNTGGIPNNHILNTLLMKACAAAGGVCAFALRIPNLAGYVVFLVYGFLLCRRLRSPVMQVAGFLLLGTHPYLLEFFGLARGYGMANGLLLGGIYHLLRWKDTQATKQLTLSLACCALAVIANFSLLHFYFSIPVAVNYIFFFRPGEKRPGFREFFRVNRPVLIVTLLLLLVLYEPLRKILQWHMTFGGTTGFWTDTTEGLLLASLNGVPYREAMYPVLRIAVMVMTALVAGVALIALFRRAFSSPAVVMALLLFCPVLLHLAEHALFGTEFLIARTGQYFIPLFIVALLFALDHLPGKIPIALTALLAAGATFHLSQSANLTHTSEWTYDANNRDAIAFIDASRQNAPVRTGITWVLEPGMNFYRASEKQDWLQPLTRDGVAGEYDFYYVTAEDTVQLLGRGKQMLKRYPLSNTYVLR